LKAIGTLTRTSELGQPDQIFHGGSELREERPGRKGKKDNKTGAMKDESENKHAGKHSQNMLDEILKLLRRTKGGERKAIPEMDKKFQTYR